MNPFEMQNRMMQIVRTMKEIPELPSEAPKDVQPLDHVEFPDKGGVLTWMGEQPYPYKGFPFAEFVDKIDIVKKFSRAVLSGLYHELRGKTWLFFTLVPAFWVAKPIVRTYLYMVYRMIDRFKLKKSMYCDAVREVHRAFSQDESEFGVILRDTLCMILEMDNAYRYRFQDIIVNLNKANLSRNPTDEFLRLLRLMSEREQYQDLKDTWTLIKFAIKFYFRVDKGFRNIIVNGLNELNLDEIKLTVEDKLFAAGRKDYVFGFQLQPTLEEDHFTIAWNKERERWQEEKQEIQNDSTKEHEEMRARHEKEQQTTLNDVTDDKLAQIREKMQARLQKMYEKRDKEAQKLADSYQNQEKLIMQAHLNDEQKKLAKKHEGETKILDQKWSKILSQGENNHQKLCQQLISTSNKDIPQHGKQ